MKTPLALVLTLSREKLRVVAGRRPATGEAPISSSWQEQSGREGGANGAAAQDRPAAQPGDRV